MNKDKKSKLLKNKEFVKQIKKYSDLDFTISEFEYSRFHSFYEAVFDSKHIITAHFGRFLNEMDKKLKEFKKNTKNETKILRKQIQKEYQLTKKEFNEIYNEDCY